MDSGITKILGALRDGEPGAQEALLVAVYDELRRLASARLRKERSGHTLQPTALVHEAWVALLGGREGTWSDRGHFFATAAKVMRQILVDQARARATQKRGGGRLRITWEEGHAGDWTPSPDEVIAIHEGLERLAAIDPRRAQVVELRFFSGLTMSETAAVMGMSERSAYSTWELARAWLFRELER